MKIWIWQPDGEQFTRVFRLKSLDLSKKFISSLMLLHEQEPIVVARAWSEPAATNAPIQDELGEAVLRMNKNPILLARMDYFSHLFSAPKFSPLLPTTYLPPLPISYLSPPTYHLPPPPYLPPTSPLLTTTYQPLPPSLHHQSSRDVEWEQAWSSRPNCLSRSLKLQAKLSNQELEELQACCKADKLEMEVELFKRKSLELEAELFKQELQACCKADKLEMEVELFKRKSLELEVELFKQELKLQAEPFNQELEALARFKAKVLEMEVELFKRKSLELAAAKAWCLQLSQLESCG